MVHRSVKECFWTMFNEICDMLNVMAWNAESVCLYVTPAASFPQWSRKPCSRKCCCLYSSRYASNAPKVIFTLLILSRQHSSILYPSWDESRKQSSMYLQAFFHDDSFILEKGLLVMAVFQTASEWSRVIQSDPEWSRVIQSDPEWFKP